MTIPEVIKLIEAIDTETLDKCHVSCTTFSKQLVDGIRRQHEMDSEALFCD